MAQLVEHNLAKVGVAGSIPVVRSIASLRPVERLVFFYARGEIRLHRARALILIAEPVPSSSSL